MKKIITALIVGMGSISSAFAGPPSGFSTLQINWTGAGGANAIPTMSTYGTLLLAVLLALVVFRISRKQGLLVRALAPVAAFGAAVAFTVMTEQPVAGIVGPPPIDGSSCSGTATYTADAPTPPPCFVNTCGAPVEVSYTFIDGQTSDVIPVPITEGTCTLDYFCEGDDNVAADGGIVPSDGLSYATAYCVEQFLGEET